MFDAVTTIITCLALFRKNHMNIVDMTHLYLTKIKHFIIKIRPKNQIIQIENQTIHFLQHHNQQNC